MDKIKKGDFSQIMDLGKPAFPPLLDFLPPALPAAFLLVELAVLNPPDLLAPALLPRVKPDPLLPPLLSASSTVTRTRRPSKRTTTTLMMTSCSGREGSQNLLLWESS